MEYTNHNSIKPTYNRSLSYGWEKMKSHFLYLFLVVLVISILDTPLQLLEDGNMDKSLLSILLQVFGMAYWLLFLPIIDYSADLIFIQAVRNEKIDLKNIIIGFKNYLNIVLVHLLVTALVGIATIALIIPGIIVACRLAFVSYLVMDKQLDPITAVETSWRMTKGHGWRIFGLGFTSFFIFIFGLILFIVGVFPAVIWIKASFAALYQGVLNENNADESAAVIEVT